jgi:hypothetical protein
MADTYSFTTQDEHLSMFVPISKRDDDQRMVYGYASTPDEQPNTEPVKEEVPEPEAAKIETAPARNADEEYMRRSRAIGLDQSPEAIGRRLSGYTKRGN